MNIKKFQPVIVLLVLAIYLYAFYEIADQIKEDSSKVGYENLIFLLNSVGGLISAFIAVKLAGANSIDQARLFLATEEDKISWVDSSLNILMLVIWCTTGLISLYWSFIPRNDINPVFEAILYDHGSTWLGTALLSMYAYFGIKPPAKNQTEPSIQQIQS
ncbi:hypothetical protein [Pontibacter sp. G13]|uniref:hypothetical protein n=1 Tax=Pontibacter sp. G13 TaxID=3074898 RepID=UPI00288B3E8B|nr:hypothetical protein [Pontibacter sp. G13]WNJ20124.1 hypothetical protein RJD25_06535 [Pontibacter sp. G13]